MGKRLVVIAASSMAVGAAGGYLYPHAPPARQRVVAAPEPPSGGAPRAEPAGLESLLSPAAANRQGTAVFELVARTAADALPALLADALDLPDSAAQDLLIRGVAFKAAEQGGARTLDWIGSLGLDRRAAQTVGLALFEALGPSAEHLDAILRALPTLDARRFRVEALGAWAEVAPERAFQEASALADWSSRFNAVARVASVWAKSDLDGALVEADLLPDDAFGRAFRTALVRHLGEVDPAAMVAYVNGSQLRRNELTGVVGEQLGLMDPEEAIKWAEQLQGDLSRYSRQVAVRNWTRTDPLAAFAYVEALPLGDERLEMLYEVARGYGRQNPDGALTWVRALTAAPPDLLGSVIAGIAEVDTARALDLAFGTDVPGSTAMGLSRGRMSMINSVANYVMLNHAMPVPELLDRVLGLSNRNEVNNALNFVTRQWLSEDPDQAFEWIATTQRLPPNEAQFLISSFARSDPARAASYTARVRPELRDLWIASVAQNYARLDPSAAVTWLRQYRDKPSYAPALAAIVMRVAELDISQAASLFADVPTSDANAAGAAEALGTQWAARNLTEARLWAARLPEGPIRDAALGGVVASAYRETVPDEGLLRLFSSDEARQRALLRTIYTVGQTDRDAARRVADRHITLPQIRAELDKWLDRPEQGRLVVYPGGFITTR
jgi:hypothetical protein